MAGLLIPFYAFAIHATVAALRLTVREAVADGFLLPVPG